MTYCGQVAAIQVECPLQKTSHVFVIVAGLHGFPNSVRGAALLFACPEFSICHRAQFTSPGKPLRPVTAPETASFVPQFWQRSMQRTATVENVERQV